MAGDQDWFCDGTVGTGHFLRLDVKKKNNFEIRSFNFKISSSQLDSPHFPRVQYKMKGKLIKGPRPREDSCEYRTTVSMPNLTSRLRWVAFFRIIVEYAKFWILYFYRKDSKFFTRDTMPKNHRRPSMLVPSAEPCVGLVVPHRHWFPQRSIRGLQGLHAARLSRGELERDSRQVSLSTTAVDPRDHGGWCMIKKSESNVQKKSQKSYRFWLSSARGERARELES